MADVMPIPVLRTKRLVLRPVRLSDAPAIQRHFANWSVVRYLSARVPWPYPPDGAERFLAGVLLPAVRAGSVLAWAIAEASDPDALIGLIEIRLQESELGHRGFWLGEPWWGRGYMTEAVAAVQDHLFLDRGVDRIVVMNAPDNMGSRRVKEKTGARRIGTTACRHHEGTDVAEVWEVVREDWIRLRGG